jgi:enoyl-[acyl-carrier protein] reductase I
MLLENKRLLITGVLSPQSIAFAAARAAQEAGAEVVLTSFGKAMGLTERSARRLPTPADVLELDVNEAEHLDRVRDDLGARWGRLDGFLHAIAFAPRDALGGNFLHTPWDSVQTAFRTSTYSLKALAEGLLPLFDRGGAIVSLDFDATVAWPIYDWMGVAKAALESVNRYLARDLGPKGVRSNLVSAGPLRTMAARGIGGFDLLAGLWNEQAPLHWDDGDAAPVADACLFLLSESARAITGEVLHVDGGYHALGAPLQPRPAVEEG